MNNKYLKGLVLPRMRMSASSGLLSWLATIMCCLGIVHATGGRVTSCQFRIRPTTAPTQPLYISLHEVELYDSAGAKFESQQLTASQSSNWPHPQGNYVAGNCIDGITSSNLVPQDYWTNLCHTSYGDSYPTFLITYPCSKGLSKAVIYNFKLPDGTPHPTGSLLNKFSADLVLNGDNVVMTQQLTNDLLQEVAFMGGDQTSCTVQIRPSTPTISTRIALREIEMYNSQGRKINSTLLTATQSSTYTDDNQEYGADLCIDGQTGARSSKQSSWSMCVTTWPGPGSPPPTLRVTYPCSTGISRVVVWNRNDGPGSSDFLYQMSMDVTVKGEFIYTYRFDDGAAEVYDVPIVLSTPNDAPAAFQCRVLKAKEEQAIKYGNKTARGICQSNGGYFTEGRNIAYTGCPPSCQCCRLVGIVENPCAEIHRACSTCGKSRIPGTSKSAVICKTCAQGWRLRRDGLSRTCDCIPGMTLNGTGDDADNWCTSCPKGQYCTGGSAENPESEASDCPYGLATVSQGAKSSAQCFTAPGFGRTTKQVGSKTVYEVEECRIGFFNVGGNTQGCQKCGSGLTTVAPRSANASMCVAPAGFYVDQGTTGKACQKGSYSGDYNTLPSCTPCPPGITTAGEGSSSSTACALAMPGYYLLNATHATACPPGSYNSREAQIYACEPCPYGMYTKEEGGAGAAECLAPPGWELREGASSISVCEVGWYKEGWNKNPCLKCGNGLSTATSGSVSLDACLVPAGYGIVTMDPVPTAVMCVNNSYGVNKTRDVVSSSRCIKCPPNMYTRDTIDGVAAAVGYTREDDCVVLPGWGVTPSGVELCPAGFYNPGYNREPCRACAAGFTTLAAGGDGEDTCVVQSGWMMDTALNMPKPCDVGYWGSGGTLDNRNGGCTACPLGFSTQADESEHPDDCNVCAAGFGGSNCTGCPHNSFSTGGLLVGTNCIPCAQGLVASRMSSHNTHCLPGLVDASLGYFALSNDSYWTMDEARSSVECQANCRASKLCILFRFSLDAGSPKCELLLESTLAATEPEATATATQALGFKAGGGNYALDYAFYRVLADLTVGVLISDAGVQTPEGCMAACNARENCELISIEAGNLPAAAGGCKLYGSELSVDWVGMYHIQGDRLYSDMLLGLAAQ